MNEEIDESEFYQQDFTTASEWEIFIARLEEVINQWKTEEWQNENQPPADQEVGDWTIKTERISFSEFEFSFELHKKRLELIESSENEGKHPIDNSYDFELHDDENVTKASCIAKWYGLTEFLLLTPLKNTGITTESRIKILLSSIYVIASNVPIFVQIQEKWQNCYLGVYESENTRTNFEMVHLQRGPRHCHFLTGLLDLFKTKIMSPINLDPINVSVQLTHVLTNFGQFVWRQTACDELDLESFSVLPFGVSVDPVNALILKSTWSHLPDHLVVDSESHSDFEPAQAQKWSLIGRFANDSVCLLADGLAELAQICQNGSNVYEILGDFAAGGLGVEANLTSPLDLLTEPVVPTISTLFNRAARNSLTKNAKEGPVADGVLVSLLYFLFPDADDRGTHLYGKEEDNGGDENDFMKNLQQDCKGCKTCGVNCLTWRLGVVLLHALQSLSGIKAFAHVWYEFVQEMRYRWEKSMSIPGILPGYPDLRTCLLNQKLQMLNCCIERKIARENRQNPQHFDSAENSSTDDDEFFDCTEKPDDESRRKNKHSLWNQPVGRLGKFGDLKLLKSGDPLYIPITQEPVIKTEDQLEEDADVLLKLGSDAEATELRARVMSASLLSDMESFKAANPGSIFEDFIRWYSPNDWLEDDSLSPRMQIAGNNIWVQTWHSAKPVPANRQKRLFDDTREAEKVLQFLDYRSISQICELIIPVVSHAAIYRVAEEAFQVADESLAGKVASLTKAAEKISRELKFQPRRFENFVQEMAAVEQTVSLINSLQYKLNPSGAVDNHLSHLIGSLIRGKEIEVENKGQSMIGQRIVMFAEEQKLANVIPANDDMSSSSTSRTVIGNNVFALPEEKEFVMRVAAVKPASYSTKSPQFLRAIVNKHEFRLVGAFSEDTVFF